MAYYTGSAITRKKQKKDDSFKDINDRLRRDYIHDEKDSNDEKSYVNYADGIPCGNSITVDGKKLEPVYFPDEGLYIPCVNGVTVMYLKISNDILFSIIKTFNTLYEEDK